VGWRVKPFDDFVNPLHNLIFQGIGAALAALKQRQIPENDHHRPVKPEGEIGHHSPHWNSAHMTLHGIASVFLLLPEEGDYGAVRKDRRTNQPVRTDNLLFLLASLLLGETVALI
jgi:hypothetical protein